jgi:hypothetical protein
MYLIPFLYLEYSALLLLATQKKEKYSTKPYIHIPSEDKDNDKDNSNDNDNDNDKDLM